MDYENIRRDLSNISRKYMKLASCDFEDIVQEGFLYYFESNGDLKVVEKKIQKFCNKTRNGVLTVRVPDFKYFSEKEEDESDFNIKDCKDLKNSLDLVKKISSLYEEVLKYRYGINTEPLTWDKLSYKMGLSPSRVRFLFYRALYLLRQVSSNLDYKPRIGIQGTNHVTRFKESELLKGELLQYLFLKNEPLPLWDIAKDFYPKNECSIKYYLEDLVFKKHIFLGHIYFERSYKSCNGFEVKRKHLNTVYSINPVQSDVELKYYG